jgi:hypothetical protein
MSDQNDDQAGAGKSDDKPDQSKTGGNDQGDPGSNRQGDDTGANKAIAAEREATKAERRRAGEEKKRADDLQARLEKLESANQTEQEKALAQARKDGQDELRAQFEKDLAARDRSLVITKAEALVLEAGFRSAADAKLLDLSEVTVENGVVGTDPIRSAIKTLGEQEPWRLAADDGKPRTPKPDPSQGSGREKQTVAGQRGLDEAARRFGTSQTGSQTAQSGARS